MGDAPLEIDVSNLGIAFGDHVVLSGVDLTVRRGELVVIVGPSGCGKSVLLELITGRMVPTHGRIRLADHEQPAGPLVDLAGLDESGLDALRRHWSIVFQHNALYSGTVRENIAVWLREVAGLDTDAIELRAREAVTRVGLEPDRVLDLQRDELSGGMAKRVAIARAIAMQPMTLFYDEPTTGLDPRHASLVHEMIAALHAVPVAAGPGSDTAVARTSVVITHDTGLLRHLRPRVVMLHGGRVHFDGPFADFEGSDDPEVRPYLEAMGSLHSAPR